MSLQGLATLATVALPSLSSSRFTFPGRATGPAQQQQSPQQQQLQQSQQSQQPQPQQSQQPQQPDPSDQSQSPSDPTDHFESSPSQSPTGKSTRPKLAIAAVSTMADDDDPDSVRSQHTQTDISEPSEAREGRDHESRVDDGAASAALPASAPGSTSALTGMASLLGPGFTSWDHSQDNLRRALDLRAEQERTKQEYYRLEAITRSFELFREAVRHNVPPHTIPMLFGTVQDYEQAQQAMLNQGYPNPNANLAQQTRSTGPASSATMAGAFAANVPMLMRQSSAPGQPQAAVTSPQHAHAHATSQQPIMQAAAPAFKNLPPVPKPDVSTPASSPTSAAQPSYRRHQHHASTSAIPTQSYSSSRPSLGSTSPTRPWTGGNQPHFPPPGLPINTSPGHFVHHTYQFHHYNPNQQRGGISSSPRKSINPGASIAEEGGAALKRQKSVSDHPDRSDRSDRAASPGTASSSGAASVAAAAAQASARRRAMGHARHRSEASIMFQETKTWDRSAPESASRLERPLPQPQSQPQSQPQPQVEPEPQPQDQNQNQNQNQNQASESGEKKAVQERSRRHGVDFMISNQE